jgi:TfoX/Sxy family transcriptional regulator of competence genes
MKLSERFAAVMVALTADQFTLVEGKPELTEENVAALEAAAADLETAKAEVETLKGENQTHAERIQELEATAADAAAATGVITEALEANNMLPEDGADFAAHVAAKINAFGKTVPAATAVVTTSADELDASANDEPAYITEIDRRAIEKHNKKNKK